MKRLEVSGAVRPIYVSLGVKRLNAHARTRKDSSELAISPTLRLLTYIVRGKTED